jgi:hypothetical protein
MAQQARRALADRSRIRARLLGVPSVVLVDPDARWTHEMDRQMRKALRSRAEYDWETHQATRQRNIEQIARIPEPEFPATGTARISSLLTEARRRRDAAYVVACTESGSGMRTSRPLDAVIESSPKPATGKDLSPVRDRAGSPQPAVREPQRLADPM